MGDFSTGQDVAIDTWRDGHRAQNYAAANYGDCHLSLTIGPDGWDDSGEAVSAMNITPGSFLSFLLTDIWVSPEQAAGSMDLGAECLLESGEEVTFTITLEGGLGTVSRTIVCKFADNGDEVRSVPSCSSFTAGGEWVTVIVGVELTATLGGAAIPRTLRAEDYPLGSLADPEDA